jgi:hypothetical protein
MIQDDVGVHKSAPAITRRRTSEVKMPNQHDAECIGQASLDEIPGRFGDLEKNVEHFKRTASGATQRAIEEQRSFRLTMYGFVANRELSPSGR